MKNKTIEKVTLPVAGAVHVKAPTSNGSSHSATYLKQFEADAGANNWTEKEKVISLVLCLKLRYVDKYCEVYTLSLIHI